MHAPGLTVETTCEPGAPRTADSHTSHPELDCVRDVLPAATLTAAAQRADRLGLSAERVLIASETLDDESYLRAFARHHGLAFETLTDVPKTAIVLDPERRLESVAVGMIPLRDAHNGLIIVTAPNDARHLLSYLSLNAQIAPHIRLTTRTRLQTFVLRTSADTFTAHAIEALERAHPRMSAAPAQLRQAGIRVGLLLAALACAVILQGYTLQLALELTLTTIFTAWVVLRTVAIWQPQLPEKPRPAIPDEALPVYSIVVALYREAASVKRLVRALQQLDYPREKIEIKLVLEHDDAETLLALSHLTLGPEFDILVAPREGPRTKPKALNWALPLLRGSFVTIYDAEDRPDPDQLRKAFETFRMSGPNLACVQARLTIDNTHDNWLCGLYTAEYAGQFDVFLPTLARLRVPLPLGGTSNHFRTDILRKAGGWDSYNVTEDADLGMRLARLGYRSDVIDSATYEEAPARLSAWLRQRTRWMKGWMQTSLVHLRSPVRLLREIGPFSFIAFNLMVCGSVITALVHPLFVAAMTLHAFGYGAGVFSSLMSFTIAVGYASSILLGFIGLRRRGVLGTAWVLLLTPLYWLLLSLAAWRAVIHLVIAPSRWEKTEHGLARSSRHAQTVWRALRKLERQLTQAMAGDPQLAARRAAARRGSAKRRERMPPDQR